VIDRLGTQVAVLMLLAAASEDRPVLITVDDLQWLDRESRDALLFAARQINSDAIAMLFATRTGPDGSHAVLTGISVPSIRLGPLPPSAAEDLVHHLRGIRPTTSVSTELVEATGGNPLALTEVTEQLTAEQLSGTEPLPATLPMSASAEHTYAALVARLPPTTVDALGLFALAEGEDVSVTLAAAAGLEISPRDAADLELTGLLTFDSGQVRLRHALLTGALLGRIPTGRQRDMHHAIAHALRGSTAPADVSRRAWHLAEACVLPDEAVASTLAAVASARERTGSHAAAALALERAARLTPDRRTRGLRYQAAADAASMAGYQEWSLQLLTSSLGQFDEPEFRARIEHAQGVRHIVAGRPRAACALLPVAAEVLRPHDPRQAGLVLADAALASFLCGRLGEAKRAAARARGLSDQADVQIAAGVVEGLSLLHLGDLSSALPLMAPPSAGIEGWDIPEGVAEYVVPLAIALTWSSRHREAGWLLDQMVERLRATGALGLLPGVLYASCYVNAWHGHLGRAYLRGREAVALADECGNRLWQLLAYGGLALTEALRGNVEESRALVKQAQLADAAVDLWHPRDVYDALGLAALSIGDLRAASSHLVRAHTPEPMGGPVFGRPSSADLVEALVRSGQPVPTEIMRSIESSVPTHYPAVAAAVWRCRGLIGQVEPGEAYENAIALYLSTDLPWQEARTRLVYGQSLRRAGRRVDARHQLARALELFDDVGSRTWGERAATELAAAGGGAVRTAQPGIETLTGQELHVALAVAGGATNREVSSRLFLSAKTVEMHLTRIYRKLGVRSRTELAARLNRGSDGTT
jgi:DNA-binding CsgD family transcriptional regulator